jgi:hypothetical protein
MHVNHAGRTTEGRIVYFGPWRSGKQTNVDFLAHVTHGTPFLLDDRSDAEALAEIRDSLARGGVLGGDQVPVEIGGVLEAVFNVCAVPGIPEGLDEALDRRLRLRRRLLMRGVSGVVFVADARRSKAAADVAAWKDLWRLLEESEPWEAFEVVVQRNRCDDPTAMTRAEILRLFGNPSVVCFDAVAKDGSGVVETIEGIGRRVVASLKEIEDDACLGAGV